MAEPVNNMTTISPLKYLSLTVDFPSINELASWKGLFFRFPAY